MKTYKVTYLANGYPEVKYVDSLDCLIELLVSLRRNTIIENNSIDVISQ